MLLALALLAPLVAPQGHRYVHPAPSFELTLPNAEWKPSDQGAGTTLALVFSPVKDLSRRCSVLRFTGDFLPRGIETREEQIRKAAGALYERVTIEPGEIAGRAATRWEYTIAGGTAIEWGFQEEDGSWVLFQIAGTVVDWDDPVRRAELESIPETFVWTGGAAEPVSDPRPTPAALRELRKPAGAAARAFEVARHRIEVAIEPEQHTLEAVDRLTITAGAEPVAEFTLYTSVVEVAEVTATRPMKWKGAKLPQADALIVTLDPPLAARESCELSVRTQSADFFLSTDQQLVAEIGVLGQVRPRSSWSTHIVWYPIDETNDAAVEIAFDVPAPLVAVTGGKLAESSTRDGRARFRYVEEVRVPRILPFGFAVGEYTSDKITRASGLTLHAYGFKGEETLVDQRIATLTECADAFESALGPLPWSDVRFVHVTPERKETGVSLPGLILVSDFYFPDLSEVDASSGNLSDPGVLGLLVVADELSHQWNSYASDFSNELAEGISTYTNALFLEVREGPVAYHNTIRYCASAWLGGASTERDRAVADPAVYQDPRYRATVFCRTPVVLDALRRRLGDERFFDGFRRAFALKDAELDGFERFERGFEAAAGEELGPYFDQWFYRGDFPELEATLTNEGGKPIVRVRQTQTGAPFTLDVELVLELENGQRHIEPVRLDAADHTFPLTLPSTPKKLALGPEGRLPARVKVR
jgi:aminopeptidase N